MAKHIGPGSGGAPTGEGTGFAVSTETMGEEGIGGAITKETSAEEDFGF